MTFRKSLLKIIAAAAILAFAGQAEAAVSVIQSTNTSATASSTTISLSFSSPVTAGSSIYVALSQVISSTTTATCADNLNGAYPAALNSQAVGSAASIYQFAFASSASGTITVICTFSTASTFRGIMIAEIGGTSGLDTGGTSGGHVSNVQTNNTTAVGNVTSGTLTPSVANGLAIGAVLDGNLSSTVISADTAAGFTDLFPTANTFWTFTTGANHGDAEYQIYSTTSNTPILFTASNANQLLGTVGALFKPSGGAGAVLAGAASDAVSASGALTTSGAIFGPILLDDPAHVGGSDNISMGSSPNTGTGDSAEVAFPKLKQWAIDLNGMVAQLYPVRSVQAPTTGFTIVTAKGVTQMILHPAGTLATGTVTFPPGPGDQQPFELMTNQTVTGLTCNTSDGSAINGAPTSLSANTAVRYWFVKSLNAWFRAQ